MRVLTYSDDMDSVFGSLLSFDVTVVVLLLARIYENAVRCSRSQL